MTVAFVISTRGWGGVKTWMMKLGHGLAPLGCRLRYYHADLKFESRLNLLKLDNRRIHFGMDFSPYRILYFIRQFLSFRPDLVVTNIDKDDRCAGVAARLTGIPVLKRIGALSDIKDNRRIRWVQGRLVDGFICPARHIRSGMAAFPWIDLARVHVVANGIDSNPIPASRGEAFRTAHGIGDDIFAVGVTSHLSDSKGHMDLLRALARLDDQIRNHIRLFVANDGVRKNDLARACKELNIAGQVTFTGYLEDIDGFLKAMDLLVLPSLKEGMPNNLLEYLRAEKPVIAGNIPGVDEIIENGNNGLLFESGNSDDLARTIVRMIQEPDLRRRLAANGRLCIERDFSIGRMVEQTLAVMESIAAQKRRSNR